MTRSRRRSVSDRRPSASRRARRRRRAPSDRRRRRSAMAVVLVRRRRARSSSVGHAVDLDPDVEDLGRLAVARPHQLEIADEPADGRGGQPLGARLVAHLVLERRDVGDEVRLAARVDRVDGEAAGRRGEEVVAAVRVAARLADLDQRPDPGQRQRPGPPRPRGPRGSGRRRTARRCRGNGGSAPGSGPRRCGAAGRCPDRGPCAAGRAGSPSTFPRGCGRERRPPGRRCRV